MTPLATLIARLEGVEGPLPIKRVLEIAQAYIAADLPLEHMHTLCTALEGSIDAAVRFVKATLPGWTISIQINLGGRSVVSVFDRREPRETGTIHPVPATALVTAALKAIQAKESGNG